MNKYKEKKFQKQKKAEFFLYFPRLFVSLPKKLKY